MCRRTEEEIVPTVAAGLYIFRIYNKEFVCTIVHPPTNFTNLLWAQSTSVTDLITNSVTCSNSCLLGNDNVLPFVIAVCCGMTTTLCFSEVDFSSASSNDICWCEVDSSFQAVLSPYPPPQYHPTCSRNFVCLSIRSPASFTTTVFFVVLSL